MISVIVYGRNDSYGYNLQKRAALSLNCIAELLDHEDDEIIFLDCNTPDDFPTFPESIHDELSERTKALLRVLRLRPAMYAQHNGGTKLPVVEPLCRNVAVRRTNPANRWILSTNTDMIFIMREPGLSLSNLCGELEEGFYELPRFEIAEAFWETLDRKEPLAAMETVRRWSRTLHLNEAVNLNPSMRFDGPGDFQLILRKQLFEIDGFNEEMIWGWHVDANICKRLYLLNDRRTGSLLDRMYGYHCQHTLQLSILHSDKKTENDPQKYFHRLKTPFLETQRDTWGIPGEDIEEVRLTGGRDRAFVEIVESLLTPARVDVTFDKMQDNFNRQKYHPDHTFPFLVNQLRHLPPDAVVAYVGADRLMVALLAAFMARFGPGMRLLVALPDYLEPDQFRQISGAVVCGLDQLMLEAGHYLFDVCILNDSRKVPLLPQMYSFGYLVDESLRDDIRDKFIRCCIDEQRRVSAGAAPRKFILAGSADTWMAGLCSEFLGVALSGYTTRVRYGSLKPLLASGAALDNGRAAAPIHAGLNLDRNTLGALRFLLGRVRPEEVVLAPFDIHAFIPARIFTYAHTFLDLELAPDWVVLNRLKLKNLESTLLSGVRSRYRVVYVNKIMMILTRRQDVPGSAASPFSLLFQLFFGALKITSSPVLRSLLQGMGRRKFDRG